MLQLTQCRRDQTVGMMVLKMDANKVAALFIAHRLTITHLNTRYYQFGRTRDRPRPRQPRVTPRAQDRHIRVMHLRDLFRLVSQTSAETLGRRRGHISCRTRRRRLREEGMSGWSSPMFWMVLADRRRCFFSQRGSAGSVSAPTTSDFSTDLFTHRIRIPSNNFVIFWISAPDVGIHVVERLRVR